MSGPPAKGVEGEAEFVRCGTAPRRKVAFASRKGAARDRSRNDMNPFPPLTVLLASLAVLLAGWLVYSRTRSASLADLLWAACIGGGALYYAAVSGGSPTSQLLVAVMGGTWAFRLIMHLLRRILAEREDARYRHLRAARPDRQGLFFALFMQRALSAALFSLPFYVAASNPRPDSDAWTLLAAAVYIVGLSGEAYADQQLSAFRAKPRHLGRTCRSGLWRYSRHPNYLFGCLQWFAYPLLALGMPWPLWSLTLLGPLLTMLGWIVSIPAAEAQAIRTRGDDYRAYRAATPMLLPWFPRGWPHDQPDTSSWHTPLPPSRKSARPPAWVPPEAYVRREAPPPD